MEWVENKRIMKESDNRNENIKRLIIYILLTFVMTFAFELAFIMNGFDWDRDSQEMNVIGFGMVFPFLAVIITRWITGEGFSMTGKDSLLLGISFRNKKWKYYIFAALIPWMYFEIAYLLIIAFKPAVLDLNYYKEYDLPLTIVVCSPIMVIISTITASFFALGEEGGWRGYMMPKLIGIMGLKRAVILGGIIWGLWHLPLTCVGHNFGTSYQGFPYVGIILMCINCIFTGIIFTFITVKTGSVWAATIMHAVNNGNPSILKYFANPSAIEDGYEGMAVFLGLQVTTGVIALLCIKNLNKDKLMI